MPTAQELFMAGFAISFLAAAGLGVELFSGQYDPYYCATEDSVRQCYDISQTGRTCYYTLEGINGSDICTNNGIWEPFNNQASSFIDGPTGGGAGGGNFSTLRRNLEGLRQRGVNATITISDASILQQYNEVNRTPYISLYNDTAPLTCTDGSKRVEGCIVKFYVLMPDDYE